ncbi:D-alanyl-D-alanine carboxypeptidase/D-alanyl-D-alanine endopeptidase [Shewanella mangrovi]|uniref:D-alanyl-D-alanine carboxypeptidase/D-alanyl-D-alanine endopeptidase n=1 Tax=Shewanella mangrovi TaxID=1515746 RepID=UPI00068B391C|nr:D-alanyl-D-alanine carboxypeptidase/D-alanyl-D-alanine-endopeptidase [Shewanella mangrovi]
MIKLMRRSALLLFSLWCSNNAIAASDIQLQHWQRLLPSDAQVSLILAAPDGQRIVERNSHRLLLPASTQKLLTAVVASKVLGDEFQFRTSLLYRGEIKQHELFGDVILRLDGDPRLTTEELANLVAELAKAGIQRVRGDVIIAADTPAPKWAPGWLWDDLGVCFAAPVGKLILDQNCVKGALSANPGQSSRVHLRYPLTIENSASYEPSTPDALCRLHLGHSQGNHYQLSGCYQVKNPLPLEIAIVDPAAYISEQLKRLWPRSVVLTGKIKVASIDLTSSKPLVSHPSMPLRPMIIEMLKKSDNLIADSLLKRVGEVTYGKYGFEYGAEAVKQTLASLGIGIKTANIVDGSGLSRYNQLTAEQLFQLLLLIQRDSSLQWLIKALPVAGLSGTLRYKRGYVNPQLQGIIWAKTGSMTGVDNLAGFIRIGEDDSQLYPFVIMENGISASSYHPKKFAPPFLKLARKQLEAAHTAQIAKLKQKAADDAKKNLNAVTAESNKAGTAIDTATGNRPK